MFPSNQPHSTLSCTPITFSNWFIVKSHQLCNTVNFLSIEKSQLAAVASTQGHYA